MNKSPYSALRRKIIFEVLEKFPDAPSNALAKIIKRDNPELFRDSEDARKAIRMYRGKAGKKDRITVKFRKYYQDVTMA